MHLTAGQASMVCDYCKGVYFPETEDEGVRVLDEAEDEQAQHQMCPVCGVPLLNAALKGSAILYCRRCRGLLTDMGHFISLVEETHKGNSSIVPSNSDPSELTRKINCPRCHKPMETHFYYGGGHVVIDDCDRCSLVWLDYGELVRISSAVRGTEAHYNEC